MIVNIGAHLVDPDGISIAHRLILSNLIIATHIRRLVAADNLIHLVANEAARLLAKCLWVVQMPADKALSLLVLGIPIHIAVPSVKRSISNIFIFMEFT